MCERVFCNGVISLLRLSHIPHISHDFLLLFRLLFILSHSHLTPISHLFLSLEIRMSSDVLRYLLSSRFLNVYVHAGVLPTRSQAQRHQPGAGIPELRRSSMGHLSFHTHLLSHTISHPRSRHTHSFFLAPLPSHFYLSSAHIILYYSYISFFFPFLFNDHTILTRSLCLSVSHSLSFSLSPSLLYAHCHR